MNARREIRLLTLCVIITAMIAASAYGQDLQRVPITTGFSQRLLCVSIADTPTWLIDQGTVYTRGGSRNWSALPSLYRCGQVYPVAANIDQITVVTQRREPFDSTWWRFQSAPSKRAWADSTPILADGSYLSAGWGYLFFTNSAPDVPMMIDVVGANGQLVHTISLQRARNTAATVMKQCGDSIIIIDRSSGRAVCEVIRGGTSTAPTEWTTVDLPDVVYGVVGDRDAFVFQTTAGVFLDHGGRVGPVRAFTDRLDAISINGQTATRVVAGGVEYAPNLFDDSVELVSPLDKRISPASFTILWSYRGECLLLRRDGVLWQIREYVDANAERQYSFEQLTEGGVSRGSRLLLSGTTVICANHLQTREYEVADAISTIRPGAVACDTVNVRSAPSGHEVLRRVGDEVWLTTSQGIFSYPEMRRIQQRPGYGAIKIGDRVYMQTSRGIEVRGLMDTLSRVVIPDVVGAGMTASSDTIYVVHLQPTQGIEPDVRVVIDAYDMDGNPYFFDRLVADEVSSRSLVFRSVNIIQGALIVNLGSRLSISTDGGVTWTEVDPGIELLTMIDDAGDEPVAWGQLSDGRSGPCLMRSPTQWVLQPVERRSHVPVLACAHMPGWFVFSTPDGVWSVKQRITSVDEGNHFADREFFDEISPDQEFLIDVRGSVFGRETAARGAYFHAVRHGTAWRIRSILVVP